MTTTHNADGMNATELWYAASIMLSENVDEDIFYEISVEGQRAAFDLGVAVDVLESDPTKENIEAILTTMSKLRVIAKDNESAYNVLTVYEEGMPDFIEAMIAEYSEVENLTKLLIYK